MKYLLGERSANKSKGMYIKDLGSDELQRLRDYIQLLISELVLVSSFLVQ